MAKEIAFALKVGPRIPMADVHSMSTNVRAIPILVQAIRPSDASILLEAFDVLLALKDSLAMVSFAMTSTNVSQAMERAVPIHPWHATIHVVVEHVVHVHQDIKEMVKLVLIWAHVTWPMEDVIPWRFVFQMVLLVWSNVIADKGLLGMVLAPWVALLDHREARICPSLSMEGDKSLCLPVHQVHA